MPARRAASDLREWMRRLLRSPLAGTSAGTLALNVVASATTFAANILAARFLGAEQYGTYAFYWSVISIVATLGLLGTSQLLVREVSRYDERGRTDLLRGLLRASFLYPLVAGLLLGLAASAILIWESPPLFLGPAEFVVAVACAVLVYVYTSRTQMALRGLNRIVAGLIPDDLIRPLVFLGLLALLSLRDGPAGGDVVLAARGGAYGVAALAACGVALALRPRGLGKVRPAYDLPGWRETALPLLVIAVVEIAHRHLGIIMLKSLDTATGTGIYRVAYEMSRGLVIPLTIAQTVAGPTIARLHEKGATERLQSLYSTVTAVLVAATVPAAVAMVLFGPELLDFFYGAEYAEGGSTLTILVASRVARIAVGTVYVGLIMLGDEGRVSWAIGIGALGSLLLNFALIPLLGRDGAAVTDLLHTVVVYGVLAWHLRRDHGLVPWTRGGWTR